MDSVGNIIMYFVIALSIIVFSVLTVTTNRILRSATYLLFVLLATTSPASYAVAGLRPTPSICSTIFSLSSL